MFGITILGNNSAVCAFGRHPTSQILQTQDSSYLIDCGEGTQLQMTKFKVKRNKINHIFISHMHGDHYYGLIALLSTMGLMGRVNDLHIYAPPALDEIIKIQFAAGGAQPSYKIYFHPLNGEGEIANDSRISVYSFKTNHGIDCWGFLFKERKNARKIIPENAKSYDIPVEFYENLQQGQDYVNKKGTIVPNDQVTIAAEPAKIYAYCADTKYDETIAEKIKGADTIYHEATYLKDFVEKASERNHSTTEQAGRIAKLANAKKLIIGHFSSKYENLEPFLEETKAIFTNTILSIEGEYYDI